MGKNTLFNFYPLGPNRWVKKVGKNPLHPCVVGGIFTHPLPTPTQTRPFFKLVFAHLKIVARFENQKF